MKRSPASRFTKGGALRRAFTLIELLVAVAVVALIVVLLSQMLSATSRTWIDGQSRVGNFTKGRSMLDLLARDLQSGIYRDNLPAFPNGRVAFYTARSGYSSAANSLRNVSWVEYDLGGAPAAALRRGDLAIDWRTPLAFGGSNAPAGAVARDTAAGVVAFQVQFVSSNGLISTNYSSTNRPRAVAVSLAVVDDKTLERLGAGLDALRDDLAAHTSGTNSAKADWELRLGSGFPWSAYPESLAKGLKIFERYVTLP